MDTDRSHPLPAAEYKNRRSGLMAFGSLQLLIGAFFLLFAGLFIFLPFSQAIGGPAVGGLTLPLVVLAIAAGAVGITFVVLGMGSVLARNWARIATLVLSWTWFGGGLLSLVILALKLPALLRGVPRPPQNLPTVMAAILSIAAALMVFLPGMFLLFYHGNHVKATCLRKNVKITPSTGVSKES